MRRAIINRTLINLDFSTGRPEDLDGQMAMAANCRPAGSFHVFRWTEALMHGRVRFRKLLWKEALPARE